MRQIAQLQSMSASVLNYRFYFYLDILRPTDQKMIAIEKTVWYAVSPRGENMPQHRDLCPPLGSVRRQRQKARTMGNILYCHFPQKKITEER